MQRRKTQTIYYCQSSLLGKCLSNYKRACVFIQENKYYPTFADLFLQVKCLPSSILVFVFYCIVDTFAFRVTAWLEDPKPVTSQHPSCLFEYFTSYVLLIIDENNKN